MKVHRSKHTSMRWRKLVSAPTSQLRNVLGILPIREVFSSPDAIRRVSCILRAMNRMTSLQSVSVSLIGSKQRSKKSGYPWQMGISFNQSISAVAITAATPSQVYLLFWRFRGGSGSFRGVLRAMHRCRSRMTGAQPTSRQYFSNSFIRHGIKD